MSQSNTLSPCDKHSTQPPEARRRYLRPHYDISQNEEAYTIRVYLPGVGREQVDVQVEDDRLSIDARRPAYAEDGWKARYQEIVQADYRLRLDLNVPIDQERIGARTEDGVLTLTLPVAEEAKPRRITVE